MSYISTRGAAAPVDFVTASLAGLAPDGGLYAPLDYPEIERPAVNAPYVETAARVLKAFAGESLGEAVIRELCRKAYAPFAHQSVAPLVEIGPGRWLLELHHGPTLAFKDVAMRLIAQLYDHVLGLRGERMTILCATSGDTGGAAAAAFAGSRNVQLVILHPLDRVSPVQRRFMTATGAANVHNLALEGDFDGTQAILKQLLADEQFKRKTQLAAVNSINWTRVAAQSVYYAQVQAQLGGDTPIRFAVPTGNFGDALAGYVAWRCGLLNRFDMLAAVNANDAMARLAAGRSIIANGATPTLSPAMDIQLPSNFERLLFEASGRDGAAVAQTYAMLARHGEAELPKRAVEQLPKLGLRARRISDDETLNEIRRTYRETGMIICPHTAVGVAASRLEPAPEGPVVTLATAHPAKFPETVKFALDINLPLPERAHDFVSRPEVFEIGPMNADFVRQRVEAVSR